MYRSLRPLLLALACLTATITMATAPAAGADTPLSALEVFRKLPATIFENTPEGLSEEEKLQLTEQGETTYWAIASDTPDELLMVSLPHYDSRVHVRRFPGNGGNAMYAVGTANGSACAIELWLLESGGRLVPAYAPEEPDVKEFFTRGHAMPTGMEASIMLCLDGDKLAATPLFWTRTGLGNVTPDNHVHFMWNGTSFEKRITPAR